MKILVSNHSLVQAGGTETFTYSLIGELIELGHNVEYFCFDKGYYSERIEKDYQISFKSQTKYDLILANHNTTVDKLYKHGLTIQTCHGIFPFLEQPSLKAHGHVAVSQEVQYHLLKKGFKSLIIYNGIDCDRYKPLKPLRITKPKVLSLCHSEKAHEIVKSACKYLDLECSILDKYNDKEWAVEKIINEHDIVIGLGRSAYEALACGRPIIVFDKRNYSDGYGDGYFIESITESLKNNCSGRALKIEFTKQNLIKELIKYDPTHGNIARNYALLSFNIQKTVLDYFTYADILFAEKQNRTLKNIIINKLRQVLILVPEKIKSPLRTLDTFIGGPILRIKRRVIPK